MEEVIHRRAQILNALVESFETLKAPVEESGVSDTGQDCPETVCPLDSVRPTRRAAGTSIDVWRQRERTGLRCCGLRR